MSEFRSAAELCDLVEAMDQREKLADLYGLSLFCATACLSTDFEPSLQWRQCVALTKYAQDCLEQAHRAGIQSSSEFEAFAFFQAFFHHELLVDHVNTDVEAIRGLLNDMQSGGEARWPYVFGNELYHKFNDAYRDTRTDHLDPVQAQHLLSGTPHGVFQTGRLVSGPLVLIC